GVSPLELYEEMGLKVLGPYAERQAAVDRGQVLEQSLLDTIQRDDPVDASETFGEGASRIRYNDNNTGGTIEVVQRADGTASVTELFVPEDARGQGIGQALQASAMRDFPRLQGQVSSKAAATTAYRLGRRP